MPVQSVENIQLTNLGSIKKAPEVLIPQTLPTVDLSRLYAINLPVTLGGIDGYEPDISIGLSEKNAFNPPCVEQEIPSDSFAKALNHHRERAINQGLMTEYDRLMALLIAHPHLRGGVNIITFILSLSRRGERIGKELYSNFTKICKSMGYTYLYGNNSDSNHQSFFEKAGKIPTSRLNNEAFDNRSGDFLGIQRSHHATIQFLDENFARRYLTL